MLTTTSMPTSRAVAGYQNWCPRVLDHMLKFVICGHCVIVLIHNRLVKFPYSSTHLFIFLMAKLSNLGNRRFQFLC